MKTKLLFFLCLTITSFNMYAQPANDDCANAEIINVTTTSQSFNFDIINATVNNEEGCVGSSPENYADVWFQFTMPSNGSINIDTGSAINAFSVYEASCNGAELFCDNIPSYIDGLAQGETYFLRIYRTQADNVTTNYQNFSIQVIEPTFPTCSNPQPLTISNTSQTINLDLSGVTYNYEYGCDTEADNYTDFWYEFTMPVNGNLYLNSTIHNGAAIYDSCGGTMLYCFSGISLIDDLMQGQTYVLRIFRSQSASSLGQQFTVKTYERIANDDCASAEMLPTLTSENTGIQFDLAGATVNTEETCTGMSDNIVDAWWQFTMPETGNLFIDTPNGNGIAVYDACNGNELFCNASEASTEAFKLIDNLIEGNTYLIRFFNTEQTLFENDFQTMNLRVYERATNDECANTEAIPTITTTPQEITFDTFGSLINFEDSCNGLPQEDFVDVWFEFTMPNNSYLKFNSYQFNFFAIYDACNGNEVACFAGVETVEGLIPNQTYLLRVFQRQTEMFHPNKSFDIWGSDTLGVEEQTLENTIQLYPNPVQDYLNISVPNNQTVISLACFDVMGKQAFNIPFTKQIDISHLKSGLYFLQIKTSSGSVTKKLLIE